MTRENQLSERWRRTAALNVMKVYHHLARFLLPGPSLQLSSTSDGSPALLYLSHGDEVELMATFTPADVISVVRPGSWEVGEAGTPAGSLSCPPAEVQSGSRQSTVVLA